MDTRSQSTKRLWGWRLCAVTMVIGITVVGFACYWYSTTLLWTRNLEVYEFDHGPILVSAMSEAPEQLVHMFPVRNRSKTEPLRMRRIHAGCAGCVETEAPEVIQPGHVGYVRVAFPPRMQLEEVFEQVLFDTNQSDKRILFRVTARILPVIHFTSPSRFDIESGAPAAGDIRIVLHERKGAHGPHTLTVVQSDVVLRHIKTKRSRLGNQFTRRDITYSIELAGQRLQLLRDSGRVPVEVAVTFGEETVVRWLDFVRVVPVHVDPPSLFVHRGRGQQEHPATITLSSGRKFTVERVEVPSGELAVHGLASTPSLAHHLQVTAVANADESIDWLAESTIVVWTATSDGQPFATVSIPVFVRGAARDDEGVDMPRSVPEPQS